jgi:hypothetical protein
MHLGGCTRERWMEPVIESHLHDSICPRRYVAEPLDLLGAHTARLLDEHMRSALQGAFRQRRELIVRRSNYDDIWFHVQQQVDVDKRLRTVRRGEPGSRLSARIDAPDQPVFWTEGYSALGADQAATDDSDAKASLTHECSLA